MASENRFTLSEREQTVSGQQTPGPVKTYSRRTQLRNSGTQEVRMVSDVVIVAAKRTPIGSFSGCLSTVPAHDLASGLIKVNTERRESTKDY